jgi:hypothetical protein
VVSDLPVAAAALFVAFELSILNFHLTFWYRKTAELH